MQSVVTDCSSHTESEQVVPSQEVYNDERYRRPVATDYEEKAYPEPEIYSKDWKIMNGIQEDSLYAIMYLPFNLSIDVLRQYIGRDGFYFKRTTTDADVYCIWHSIDNPTQIEIWGRSNRRIEDAMSRLWRRLFVVIDRRVQNEQSVNQAEYAWWEENYSFFKNVHPRQIIRFHYNENLV